MPPGFLQVAIPVLYVYDPDATPTAPPGFDMNLLPVISRALKHRAGTQQITVITGTPTLPDALIEAYSRLALQYGELQKASPEAANLIAAEFIADNFDPQAVMGHLGRIVEERAKGGPTVTADEDEDTGVPR